MAKELEKARKDYAPLEKLSGALTDELGRIKNNADHMAKMAFEAFDEISRRVQELKDGGQNGTNIDDFKNDGEIKKILAELDGYKSKTDEMRVRWAKMLPEGQALLKSLNELDDRITEETDTRTKKKDRSFVPIDSKSLPDLVKLGKEVNKTWMHVRDEIVGELKLDFRVSSKLFTSEVDRAVKETKQSRQTDDRKAVLGQALNIRLLNGRVNKARAGFKEITECCTRAIKALAASDGDTAKQEVGKARETFKEIAELHKTYAEALGDLNTYDRQTMEQSKDGKIILDLIEKGINKCYTDGDKLVKAAAAKVGL